MSKEAPSRVIFIGNIPYDTTEPQLLDIFRQVGPIRSFRLMYDRETGRPRGYAFCEYLDVETAESAIRNLNGFEVSGRTLNVGRADNNIDPSSQGGKLITPTTGSGSTSKSQPLTNAAPTTLKPLANFPPTPTLQAINALLTSPQFTSPPALLDLLHGLQTTVQQAPDQAHHLLANNPALSYALLQVFVVLGLVDRSTLDSLLMQSNRPPVPPAAPFAHPPPPPTGTGSPNMPPPPPPANSGVLPASQHQAVLMQILQMTPEMIAILPPEQQVHIMHIRQQYEGSLLQQQQQQQQQQQPPH